MNFHKEMHSLRWQVTEDCMFSEEYASWIKKSNPDAWLWYKQQNDPLSKKISWKSGLNWIGLSKVLDMRNIEILLFDLARLF